MKENWTYKKLGEVCDIYQPQTISTEMLVPDGEYLLYGANGVIGRYDKYNHTESEVLLTCRGATCGSINVSAPYSWINGNAMVIHPIDDSVFCSRSFLVYLMKSIDYSLVITGAAQPQITRQKLSPVKIAIPPIETQSRIVSELDLLQSIIDKQKAQLKELDNLAQAVFYDMFGDPVENDKGWEVKKLGEVCDEIGDGLHGTPQYDANGSFAFINGNNLIDGKIVITDKTQFVTDAEAEKIFIAMDANTVLVSINGTLGKTAIYNNERIVLGKSACYCKLNDVLMAKFVLPLMNTQEFQLFLENNSSKSTIKNVGLKAIRNYRIILPPLSLQQSFTTKIESIEKQKAAITKSIEETQKLFDYTMDKYFG